MKHRSARLLAAICLAALPASAIPIQVTFQGTVDATALFSGWFSYTLLSGGEVSAGDQVTGRFVYETETPPSPENPALYPQGITVMEFNVDGTALVLTPGFVSSAGVANDVNVGGLVRDQFQAEGHTASATGPDGFNSATMVFQDFTNTALTGGSLSEAFPFTANGAEGQQGQFVLYGSSDIAGGWVVHGWINSVSWEALSVPGGNDPPAVPEPASLVLAATGLLALAGVRRRVARRR